jgi:YD repeat-containing protein
MSNKWYNTWAMAKGVSARVSTNAGTFSIPGVPVVAGTNTLNVTVRDVSGNTATQAVTFGKSDVAKSQWLGYDNNGNLVSVTSATAAVLYYWDAENRLTNITVNGVTVLECWYDGHGRGGIGDTH